MLSLHRTQTVHSGTPTVDVTHGHFTTLETSLDPTSTTETKVVLFEGAYLPQIIYFIPIKGQQKGLV